MIRKILIYILLVGLLAIPIVLWLLPANFFDNGNSLCLSVILFDVECYGCGMTRAMMHLIHFDFQEAFFYNAISFAVLPLLIYEWQKLIKKTINKINKFKH